MSPINEDGTAVLIEALYARYGVIETEPRDSVEATVAFLTGGGDGGYIYATGVFVDGEPRVADPYVDAPPPTPTERLALLKEYAKASRT